MKLKNLSFKDITSGAYDVPLAHVFIWLIIFIGAILLWVFK